MLRYEIRKKTIDKILNKKNLTLNLCLFFSSKPMFFISYSKYRIKLGENLINLKTKK